MARDHDEAPSAADADDREARAFSDRVPVPRLRRRSPEARSRDRETLWSLIGEIPNFLKLLGRLVVDTRVSRVDKGILLATIGYILVPMDLVPDFIPFLGQIDDLYLLALALNRLLVNAGVDVLLEHWDGEIDHLETAIAALDKAGSLLPARVRSVLQAKVD